VCAAPVYVMTRSDGGVAPYRALGPRPEEPSPPGAVTGPAAAAWVSTPDPRPDARLRLFCFPYAGAGASVFHSWPALVPASVEVCLIQLPGREGRLLEPACSELPVLVDRLGFAVRPWLDRPFAFFGHSMGALIAFELARALRKGTASEPTHLFLSAHCAPHLRSRGPLLHRLTDSELLLRLRQLNGTPDEVLANVELMRLLLPTLRADCLLCETYEHSPGEPLACGVTALGGREDPAVAEAELEAWRRHTRGPFELQMLPGDHFYLHSARPRLLRLIVGRLTRDRRSRAGRARDESA
jgi:medium-chain acyl-[acyl-carrier-protein] hydrolase